MRTIVAALLLLAAAPAAAAPQAIAPASEQPGIIPASAKRPSTGGWAVKERRLDGEKLAVVFRLSPLANLVYQLDCMGHLPYCSREAVRDLWKGLGWNEADEAKLREWTALQQRYGRVVELDPAPEDAPYPLPDEAIELGKKLRQASFVAEDPADYVERLELLMPPQDAARAAGLLAHFEPRFRGWWRERARTQARPFFADVVRQARTHQLVPRLERAAAWLHTENLDTPFHAHLIAVPGKGKMLYGERLEHHATIEIGGGASAAGRLDVVAHEAIHHLRAGAPASHQAELLRAFAEAEGEASFAAWSILEEALPSALGNGWVAAPLRAGRSLPLYGDPAIDKAARALLELVEPGLSSSGKLEPRSFAGEWLAAYQEALGKEAIAPAQHLRMMALAHEPAYAASVGSLLQHTRSNSYWPEAALRPGSFRRGRHLSGVVMASPASLRQLAGWKEVLPKSVRSRLAKEAADPSPRILALRRSERSWLYVFVASNPAEMERLVAAFPACAGGVEGVCARPARP